MNRVLPLIRPTRVRLYLVLLHSMFLLLYGCHLTWPLSVIHAAGSFVLALLTLLLLTVPRQVIEAAWFIGLLALGNASVLFVSFGATTDLWLFGAVLLLVTIASYVPSIVDYTVVSSLIIGEYGLILYRTTPLDSDRVWPLLLLLALTLAFVSKISTAQAEIQRIVKMEDQPQQQRAGVDALTGLPNRAQFLERLDRIVQYTDHNRNFRFAVLFLDLDGFKPINDKHGHKAGDVVLRHVSRIFQSCLRQGDVVGRYGGDEFVFLLNQVNHRSEATQIAERILTRLQAPIDVGERVSVGASIGIAFNTNMGETAEALLKDADQAMYRAKSQGKNRYVISDHRMDVPTPELLSRWKRMMQLKWY